MYESETVNLILPESAMAISVPPEGMEIGRSTSCLLRLDDPNVSRRHARIVCGETPVLVDLASKNGTYVNGTLLQGSHELHDGDTISFGDRVLTVRIAKDENAFDSSEDVTSNQEVSEDFNSSKKAGSGTMTGLGAIGRVSLDPTCPVCGEQNAADVACCGGCGYNYPKARPRAITHDAIPVTEGRRREARRPVDLEATYSSSSISNAKGMLENVSSEGVFIRAEDLDGIGTYCTITVNDEHGDELRIEGFVRHVLRRSRRGKKGMGVEFGKLSPRAQTWLSCILRRLDGLD
ncbi:MAG: FHA domain-containing protein [Deltaproteobacteria bacterium]|nr:FHA domain-containing protein [Deltaproteobacteria bacterium]